MQAPTQQIFYIHGGQTFQQESDYLAYLQNQAVSLDRVELWPKSLQQDLNTPGIQWVAPQMPCKQNAQYQHWQIFFRRYLQHMQAEPILIGFSLGASFLIQFLQQNKLPVLPKAIFLVAPAYDGQGSLEQLAGDFDIKPTPLVQPELESKLNFYFSQSDKIVPISNMQKFQKLFPAAHCQSFPDKNGHFLTPDFPELQADIALALVANS